MTLIIEVELGTFSSNAAFIKPSWNTDVSQTTADWSHDQIPEALWEVASNYTSILFDTNSTSIELLNSERSLDLRENKFEPKHHTEAMSRPSERIFWMEAESKEINILERLQYDKILSHTCEEVFWVKF